MSISEEQVRDALRSVRYPGFSRDIVSFGLVKGVDIDNGDIKVQLALATNDPNIPATIKNDSEKILPIEQYNLKLMSMGFLLDDASPAILRGPMVTRYTQQFLRQVDWGELDFLVLDLPPGTGDIQLTIVQTVALSGAIIVTTPQEVALIDARKAATMFEKVNVPVLGLVENMSYFVSPSDNKRYDIFGSGGGEREAKRLRVPLLGQVPIDIATREAGDRGQPIVGQDRQSPVAVEFMAIAQRIRDALA